MKRAFYGDALARVHHEGFGDVAAAAGAFLVADLKQQGVRGGRVADLGCGAGTVLRALVDSGHHAWGWDVSPAMVKLARRHAPSARVAVGSLWDVALPGELDLVSIIGEPLNYVPRKGGGPPVEPFLRRVARALRPGGRLVFDVIVRGPGRSLSRHGHVLGDDWAVLVDTHEDEGRTHLARDITTFARRGRAYARTREVHHVRVFDTKALRAALVGAGFSVRTMRAYGDLPLAHRRCAFVCTRA